MSDRDNGQTDLNTENTEFRQTASPQHGSTDEHLNQTDSLGKQPLRCICGEEVGHVQDVGRSEQSSDSDYVVLTCGHVRCVECFNTNVRVGLDNSRGFPPFCHECSELIEVDEFTDYLSIEVMARYIEVKDEFADRTPLFCGKKGCSKYLKRNRYEDSGRWATCATCTTKTCIKCSQSAEAHAVLDTEGCPDRVDKASRDLMNRSGWKECPFCHHMIEKTEGCLHMICFCGCAFCYGCGIAGLKCGCADADGDGTEWMGDVNNLWSVQQGNNHAAARGQPVSVESEEVLADWPEYSTPTELDWAQEMARQLGTRPLHRVVEDSSWSESSLEDNEEVQWNNPYAAQLREIEREASVWHR